MHVYQKVISLQTGDNIVKITVLAPDKITGAPCGQTNSSRGNFTDCTSHTYEVTLNLLPTPLPWFWIVVGVFFVAVGLGVASFFGYVNFLSRLYRVKERDHRNEGKDDPFLEYCKTCRVNVAAKKYVGEDTCPQCGNWL
jgi:hypothetical protein